MRLKHRWKKYNEGRAFDTLKSLPMRTLVLGDGEGNFNTTGITPAMCHWAREDEPAIIGHFLSLLLSNDIYLSYLFRTADSNLDRTDRHAPA